MSFGVLSLRHYHLDGNEAVLISSRDTSVGRSCVYLRSHYLSLCLDSLSAPSHYLSPFIHTARAIKLYKNVEKEEEQKKANRHTELALLIAYSLSFA